MCWLSWFSGPGFCSWPGFHLGLGASDCSPGLVFCFTGPWTLLGSAARSYPTTRAKTGRTARVFTAQGGTRRALTVDFNIHAEVPPKFSRSSPEVPQSFPRRIKDLQAWLAIVRACYTMENGPNDKNGKKTWNSCPDRKWGKNGRKIPKKWKIGPIFHFFRYFSAIFSHFRSGQIFHVFPIFSPFLSFVRPVFDCVAAPHDCNAWPAKSPSESTIVHEIIT